MTPREQVDAAVSAYVNGGMPALEEITGPDGVDSPVFWEAVTRIGASRRALVTGRGYRGGIDRWDKATFDQEEAHGDAAWEARGGNR